MKIYILLIAFFLTSLVLMSQTGNTLELNNFTQKEIVHLNSFFKSKEFNRLFKFLYHCRPKLNYYNLNSNARSSYLEQLDSVEIIKFGLKPTLNGHLINDTLKFWTSTQILNMRNWFKRSKYYIVFYKPENHIISFKIFRADITSSEDIKYYTTHLGRTRSSLHFTLLLTDDNYRILDSGAGIKD